MDDNERDKFTKNCDQLLKTMFDKDLTISALLDGLIDTPILEANEGSHTN